VLRTQLAAQAVLPVFSDAASVCRVMSSPFLEPANWQHVVVEAEASFSTPKGICGLNRLRVSCASHIACAASCATRYSFSCHSERSEESQCRVQSGFFTPLAVPSLRSGLRMTFRMNLRDSNPVRGEMFIEWHNQTYL
jgi:hypothetical protein